MTYNTTYTDWSLSMIQTSSQQVVFFATNLLLAILIFIVGYIISAGIGRLITEILKSVKFNILFEKEGWKKALQRANVEVDPSEFIGAIFKWVFVIIALMISVDFLNLTNFADFLRMVLNYIPNVIVAVLLFVVVIIISDIIEKLVRATVERLKVGYGYLAASIVKWAIWIFTFFLILDQLLPVNDLVKTLYTAIIYGFVFALSLGVALALGLGGKETASKVIQDTYKKITEK